MFKVNIDKVKYTNILLKKILDNSGQIEFKNLLDLSVAFLNFSLRCYPKNSD